MSWHVPNVVMLAADRFTQILYKVSGGWLGEKQLSYSMLLLHTIGRKTGQRRTHTLLYVRDGENLVICASNNGSPRLPAWYLNLQAQPRVCIQHGRVRREVMAEAVGPQEWQRLWQKLLTVRPQYADYQKNTSREFPIVILKPLPATENVSSGQGGKATMTSYVFDPQVIHEVSRKHLDQPLEQMFASITAELAERYPGAIDDSKPWIFNNAGGVMLQMKLLHASTKEYIMIWGTPIGSEGHTGRHLAEFYDTVLDGEAWYYSEGQFTRDEYKPGDHIFLGKGQSAGMHYPDHVWMVEYARGILPSLLPFGLADALLSTLDFKTALQTIQIYFSLLARSLSKSQRALLGVSGAATLLLLALSRRKGRNKKYRHESP
ncbi:MAG TPA: nitroreductase/quinone reductase family protein [Ktedonobacteraceae bacterium]|nr:nitroreductase/quinone reductase family protein [Ktedonobacteraceae bacterium]